MGLASKLIHTTFFCISDPPTDDSHACDMCHNWGKFMDFCYVSDHLEQFGGVSNFFVKKSILFKFC